ncbi:unnamed protein product (macronuclear) [Paramecium tetraurelia]|uniref:Uncharacterized protein n=1 Tax=Paramecium tetraurelia TaxID=5888 RepID=A0CBF4_PARTE|nr:uncharacterized protein GSPATT00036904001 [Paramecium tetraurelia]CAK68121.1 unnamed protein product [Paramecium tetraurelia]|eukprot:XP_001435518.1 hypothetical protein (macronuclear) [Paramecium tetraurelia strain d4-2]
MNSTNTTRQNHHTQSSAIYVFIGVFVIIVLLVIAIIMLIQRENRRLHQRVRYSEMTQTKKESNATLDGQSIEISQSEQQPSHPDKLVTFAQ